AIVTEKSKVTSPIKKEIEALEELIPTLSGKHKSQTNSQILDLQEKLEKLNEEFKKRLDEV
ncbi:MAG: hypothetical protein GY932_11155, partial [Arcobacter sp.]|nr:hypothetical protein [Arcobacter sp.]